MSLEEIMAELDLILNAVLGESIPAEKPLMQVACLLTAKISFLC